MVRLDVCSKPNAEAIVELIWLSSPVPRAGVTLEWCWPLLEVLAHCHICGTTLENSYQARLEGHDPKENKGEGMRC